MKIARYSFAVYGMRIKYLSNRLKNDSIRVGLHKISFHYIIKNSFEFTNRMN